MDLYYERQLEAKIRRQKKEIKRLLKENAELKKKYKSLNKVLNDFNDIVSEPAIAEGQEEAWELARKIAYDGYRNNELKEIFDSVCLDDIFNLTYTEAAAKVAEWERQKKEICVGDVVEREGSYGVVVGAGEVYVKGFTSDWTPFQWMKRSCTKTGRHIDVDTLMAQIGESDA